MRVRIPDSGREIEVPTGLTGSALQRHVQGVLEAEALAAQQAEAAKLATAQQAEEDRFAALERELASERAKQDALHKEISELKRVSPEAASMATVLSQMTREANDAFERNQRLLAAMNRFADKQGSDITDVANLLAQQNATLDEEAAARKLESSRFMNSVALAQGLPAPHPHLLEDQGDG